MTRVQLLAGVDRVQREVSAGVDRLPGPVVDMDGEGSLQAGQNSAGNAGSGQIFINGLSREILGSELVPPPVGRS